MKKARATLAGGWIVLIHCGERTRALMLLIVDSKVAEALNYYAFAAITITFVVPPVA